MNAKDEVICPWCHTEIVWDPEIGPEDECPHCLNDLGDYRSIDLKIKQTGQPLVFGEDTGDEDDFTDNWDDSDDSIDSYGETVQKLTDEQEEAPECSNCHEFMLLAGAELQDKNTYIPHVPKLLNVPFLKAPFTLQVYVCPSCFKVEKFLADADRITLVERLKQE